MSSDMPPGAVPPNPGRPWGPPTPAGSTSSPPTATPPVAFGRPTRWPTFAALGIALIALAVGLVGWFRPVPRTDQPPAKPTYTDQQTADAKAKVCDAVEKFNRAVSVGNSLPKGSDTLVTDLNTRQIFDVFSRLFLATLAEEPATPADLATAVRQQASAYQDVVIGYLDGLDYSDPGLKAAGSASNQATDTIRQLCK